MLTVHLMSLGADLLAAPPTPTPLNPAPQAPAGLDRAGEMFLAWLKWILMVAGVGGLFACGIMMAVGRRNRSSLAADGAAGIPWVLGGLTLGAIGAVIVGAVLPS